MFREVATEIATGVVTGVVMGVAMRTEVESIEAIEQIVNNYSIFYKSFREL